MIDISMSNSFRGHLFYHTSSHLTIWWIFLLVPCFADGHDLIVLDLRDSLDYRQNCYSDSEVPQGYSMYIREGGIAYWIGNPRKIKKGISHRRQTKRKNDCDCVVYTNCHFAFYRFHIPNVLSRQRLQIGLTWSSGSFRGGENVKSIGRHSCNKI
jgi:hypothetical protein